MSRPSRLSSENIEQIRQSSKPVKQIASEFGISMGHVSRIRQIGIEAKFDAVLAAIQSLSELIKQNFPST